MDRRSFLRLTGAVNVSGLAAACTSPGLPGGTASLESQMEISPSTPAAGSKALGGSRPGEVIAGLYRLAGIRGVNAYLWMSRSEHPDPGEIILFDCGWPWSDRGLAAGLDALGTRPLDVRAIAVTHGDFDHVGQLAAFAAQSGAEIIAHELEAPRLSSDQWRVLPGAGTSLDPVILAAGPLYRLWPARPVKVTRPIRDGAEIGEGWIAVHTPGHTPGHTAFFHPALRVLIAGDALGSVRNNQVRLPKRIYAEDWAAALRSVQRLAELRPDVICFGHGRELHNASAPLQALAKSLSAGQPGLKVRGM